MLTLTGNQKKAYDFIRSEVEEKGLAPSFQEIADLLGLKSKANVYRIMEGLEQRGAIRRVPNRKRYVEIVEQEPWKRFIESPELIREIERRMKLQEFTAKAVITNALRSQFGLL